MDINTVRLHQRVKTPHGIGVVQGRIVDKDKPRLIVSFATRRWREHGFGKINGIWHLAQIDPEDCEDE